MYYFFGSQLNAPDAYLARSLHLLGQNLASLITVPYMATQFCFWSQSHYFLLGITESCPVCVQLSLFQGPTGTPHIFFFMKLGPFWCLAQQMSATSAPGSPISASLAQQDHCFLLGPQCSALWWETAPWQTAWRKLGFTPCAFLLSRITVLSVV